MAAESKTAPARKRVSASRLMSEPATIMGPRLIFILSAAILCIIGLIMVYSASSIAAYDDFGDAMYYFKRQGIFLILGLLLCALFSRIPYSFWATPVVCIVAWGATVAFLALTAFGGGISALGAERSISIAGFALQPAEFAKITVVFAVASLTQMWTNGELPPKKAILFLGIAIIIPLFLIYRQPDLGTAIILCVGLMALALLVGMPWIVVGACILVLVAYVVFACITQPYHLDRIISMFNPWIDPTGKGYQSIQALYAFGNGGVFGTGIGLSKQKFLYLPYAHTDFIYAIIGEELGLIGATVVALLFGVLIFAGMRICRNAPDLFGCMLAGSFTVMIGFQACVNMACVSGIAPVTGKALPLISYGGSSLVATLIMIGIVLSVSFKSKVGMAYERKRDNFLVIDGGKGKEPSEKPKADDRSTRWNTGEIISKLDNVIPIGNGYKRDKTSTNTPPVKAPKRPKNMDRNDQKSTRRDRNTRNTGRQPRVSERPNRSERSARNERADQETTKKNTGGYASLKKKPNPNNRSR